MNHRMRTGFWLLLGMAVLSALLCYPLLMRGAEAVLLLADLGDSEMLPGSYRQQHLQRETVHFQGEGQRFVADLYRPAHRTRAVMVLQHGAAEGGKDDVRLVRFAEQLARAGFTVIVPEIPGAKHLHVSSSDIPALHHAVDYLQQQGELGDDVVLGMAGFSVSSGLVLNAALRPPLQQRVDFVLAVGGYFDLEQALHFMTTGGFLLDGQLHYQQPNEYGKWVFVLSNLEKIGDRQQAELLHRIARTKSQTGVLPAELVSQLRGEALALYEYVENREFERAAPLMQRLPQAIRNEVARLNLANKPLSALRARVLLVHGRDDRIIPYAQSVALERALPAQQAVLFLLSHWGHMEAEGSLRDGWQMYRALYRLLELRDTAR